MTNVTCLGPWEGGAEAMLQCVINGPPNKRNVLSSLGASHASTVCPPETRVRVKGGEEGGLTVVRSSRKFCRVGEISDGPMDSGPASLVVCSLLTSSDLDRSAAGRTLSRALLGRFSWPWPQSNFHAGTGCWPLLACPRGLCGLDTWTSRQYTPSRSQQQKSKSLAGWVLTSSVPAQECLARTLSSSHNARAIIRNKGPLNHGLTMLSEAATWGRM